MKGIIEYALSVKLRKYFKHRKIKTEIESDIPKILFILFSSLWNNMNIVK